MDSKFSFLKYFVAFVICIFTISVGNSFKREFKETESEFNIRYNLGTLTFDTIVNGNNIDVVPIVENVNNYNEKGKPFLPRILENILVPDQHICKVSSSVICVDTIKCRLSGCPQNVIESKIIDNYEIEKVVEYIGTWPSEWVSCLDESCYRDVKYVPVIISPCKYNYEKEELYYCSVIDINVTFEKICDAETTSLIHSCAVEDLSGISKLPSKNFLRRTNLLSTPSIVVSQLIISPIQYQQYVERLAKWKRRLGFNVLSMFLTQEQLLDPEYVKSIIEEKYKSDPNLEYILLVGSGDVISPFEGKYMMADTFEEHGGYFTDYYFGCMDGEQDGVADLKIGRLPARDTREAMEMVDKILRYESNPPIDVSSYFSNASHVSYFETRLDTPDFVVSAASKDDREETIRRFVLTSEDIRNYVMGQGKEVHRIYAARQDVNPKYWSRRFGYGIEIPMELQRPQFSWDGGSKDIINDVNSGISYLLYRGHGSIDGFASMDFNTKDLNELNNFNMLPVVFSITCNTGSFWNPYHYPAKRSLAEDFLRYYLGGASGVIAANQVSYSGYNDHLAGGIFNALYPEPGLGIYAGKEFGYSCNDELNTTIRGLGDILQYAQRQMCKAAGISQGTLTKSYCRYNMEIFHCLGDPSMAVYTKSPIYKKPVYLCEGGKNIYLDGSRKVVLVSKANNEVCIINPPIRLPLEDYLEEYYVSLISDDTVPILLNEYYDGHKVVDVGSAKIENISESNNVIDVVISGGNLRMAYNFDIYGNLVSSCQGSREGSVISLTSKSGYNMVVIEDDNGISDSKGIYIK